jgi:hypothetical protein
MQLNSECSETQKMQIIYSYDYNVVSIWPEPISLDIYTKSMIGVNKGI